MTAVKHDVEVAAMLRDAMDAKGAAERHATTQRASAAVKAAKTKTFDGLSRASCLDPKLDYRLADWRGMDFSGCNLRGFDFAGARLWGAKFDGALIAAGLDRDGKPASAAIFDEAEWSAVSDDWEPGSTDPGVLRAPVADLTTAADYDVYLRDWSPGPVPVRRPHLRVGAIFQDAPFAPELVVVPAGSFMMGSSPEEIAALKKEYKADWYDAEGPQHEVTIPAPFAVGRYAVTFEEWEWAQQHPDWQRHSRLDLRTPNDWKWGRERRPVIDVSWQDATAYCQWLSQVTGKPYRLLSEAEWEFCCRSGTESRYSFGDTIAKSQAQFSEGELGSAKQTVPVGSFPPNGWGLHDMHGNVWEWCEDNWHENYKGDPPGDGSVWSGGDASLRVLRGGSWVNFPQILRSADRGRIRPVSRDLNVGFRVARTLLPL